MRRTETRLLICLFVLLALVLANSPLAEAYDHLLHSKVGVSWGDEAFKLTLHHWINDGLMVIFFFVVGLEIKRELVVGELSEFQKASLPVAAALGGMVVPAMLYAGVELARRLAAAGHRLSYASFAGARRTVEGQGLAFLPLEPSRYDAFLAADAKSSMPARLRRLRPRRERALDSLAVAGFVRTVREADPDLLLIDGEMHEHVIAASATGPPIALLNSFVSIWRRPGLPPPHHLARPGVGWTRRACSRSAARCWRRSRPSIC